MCEKYLWATSKTMLLNKEISLDLKARNTASALVCFFFFFATLFKSVVLWDFIMTSFKGLMTATDSLGVEKHMYTFIKRDTQLLVI